MKQSDSTSSTVLRDGIMKGIIEGNTETASETPIVVHGITGTFADTGSVVPDQVVEAINKDKPWRQIIKRRIINGGSDYENLS